MYLDFIKKGTREMTANEPVDYPPLQAGGIIENNKPVAWTNDYCLGLLRAGHEANLWAEKDKDIDDIPLYTHPVKELTDEEIGDFTHRMVLCCGVNPNSADINVLGLKFIVEDILRKAQEK
jgi:hypothetical protein